MTMGLTISADPLGTVALSMFDGLEYYQSSVAGYIEMIDLEDPSVTTIVNEEGKVQSLPSTDEPRCCSGPAHPGSPSSTSSAVTW